MNCLDLLRILDKSVAELGSPIDASTREEFKRQFQDASSSPNARNLLGIVYVWSTRDPIPRMKGRSDVLYVGQTIQTFFDRHHRYAEVESSGYNWKRYEHAIKLYGSISFRCVVVGNPRDEEKKLLRAYAEEHLEYPPINASS